MGGGLQTVRTFSLSISAISRFKICSAAPLRVRAIPFVAARPLTAGSGVPSFVAACLLTVDAGDDELVNSLVSQFSDINTAFDKDACLAKFVEVAKVTPEEARSVLEGARVPGAHTSRLCAGDARFVFAASQWNLRLAMKEYVARSLRAAPVLPGHKQPGADSDDDDDDDDDDDEPHIKPVYRTQSGRGVRMRAADRM